MEAARREKIIKQLKDVVNSLMEDRPSAYDRCVDLTEKLFYKNDKVVLVMNDKDYEELANIWHTPQRVLWNTDKKYIESGHYGYGVLKDFQTPHGEVAYLIVDRSVKEMHGYTL